MKGRTHAVLPLELGRSRILAVLIALSHVLAASALMMVDATPLATALVGVLLAGSCGRLLATEALRVGRNAVTRVEIDPNGTCTIVMRDGTSRQCAVLRTTFVTASLVILNLRERPGRRVRHVVIVRDAADARVFRQVRVLLRWAGTAPGGDDQPQRGMRASL